MQVLIPLWIRWLWARLCGNRSITHDGKEDLQQLPDDVVMEILSWLPGYEVLKCKNVCKKWQALTSSHDFAELQVQHAPHIILVQFHVWYAVNLNELNLLFLDEKANRKVFLNIALASGLRKGHPVLVGSCKGLLLFRGVFASSVSYLCNPVTLEYRTLRSPVPRGSICGFFFDDSSKEYKLLHVCREGDGFEYSLLSLGVMVWRKVGFGIHSPSAEGLALVLGTYLFWMVANHTEDVADSSPCSRSIMSFNTETRDFGILPHPAMVCRSRSWHEKMRLLEMDGRLMFSYSSVRDKVIHIHALQSLESWLWNWVYKVDLNWDVKLYPYAYGPRRTDDLDIMPVSIQDEELLLFWPNRGLYRYNLQKNTFKQVKVPGLETFKVTRYQVFLTTYTMSLVSLKDLLPKAEQ